MMLAVISNLCARYKGHSRIKCSVVSLPVVQSQVSLLASWKLCRFYGFSEDLEQLAAGRCSQFHEDYKYEITIFEVA